MPYVDVDIAGLDKLVQYFETMPQTSAQAASMAINQIASRGGLKLARESIYDQINFPQGYLEGDRLRVEKFAKPEDLEAVIIGRKRATSLARFAQGAGLGVKGGVRVAVHKGNEKLMRRAWLVRLRKGASLTQDNYNVGLALRINPGEQIDSKFSAHQAWLVPGRVALLYGPSVDQIFRDVAEDIAPKVGDMVADEFLRQFERISR